jgi:hypothetical protein
LVLAAAIALPLSASAAVDLPDKTSQQLLEFARSSHVDQFSGTITQTSELGLPDLGGVLGRDASADAGASDAMELLTGDHTADVYVDGDRARLQVLDRLAERNVYVDRGAGEAWFVDSESKTATKYAVSGDPEVRQGEGGHGSGAAVPTPDEVFAAALDRLDASTKVTVGADGRVAGRDAYDLVLEPRTEDTLVKSIAFGIDGETGAVLSASVTGRGSDDPAFAVAFTDISFTAPDASTLQYDPAHGFTVVEKDIPLLTAADAETWSARAAGGAAAERPVVHGEGWSTVYEFTGVGRSAESTDSMLDRLTRPVDGGRVLETSLVTMMITDDGRMLVGAVPAERLVDVAAGG